MMETWAIVTLRRIVARIKGEFKRGEAPLIEITSPSPYSEGKGIEGIGLPK
jgi:hypothetical protein